jgi:hypothetical protein
MTVIDNKHGEPETDGVAAVAVQMTDPFPGPVDAASGATPEQLHQLRTLIFDQVDYTPVSGAGDAAFLATVIDRSLVAERQAVLIIKSGSDVFAFGVMGRPDALTTATALAQALMAAQPS